MKRIYILLIALPLASCQDFLNEDPPTFISTTNFFKTPGEARAACDAVYLPLSNGNGISSYGRFWPAIDLGTGDVVSRTPMHPFDAWFSHTISGSHTWSTVWGQWSNFWQGIGWANMVIHRVAGIEMNEAEKNAIIGEARALRALYYYHLVRTYGDVPVMVEEVETFDDFQGKPRTDVNTIYDEIIIPDLQFAEEHCEDALHAGRITKWSAKMILADVYLTRAGWRRTSQGEFVQGDPSNWTMARDKALEIIQNSPHELITEPVINGADTLPACGVAWDPDHPFTKESLLELGLANEAGFGSWLSRESNPFPHGAPFWGPPGAQPFLAEGNDNRVIDMAWPGHPPVPAIYIPTPDLWRAFEAGDERRDWGLMTKYITPEGDIILCQPTFRKYVDINYYMGRPNTSFRNTNSNFVIYRLADALLIYAEAANEVEGAPSTDAYDAVNRIRNRAGLASLAQGLSQDEFRKAVWQERRVEFHAECKRRFDLIRTKRLKTETLEIEYVWEPSDNPPYMQQSYINANGYGISAPWPDHEWLMPIPSTELSINDQWADNEGY